MIHKRSHISALMAWFPTSYLFPQRTTNIGISCILLKFLCVNISR